MIAVIEVIRREIGARDWGVVDRDFGHKEDVDPCVSLGWRDSEKLLHGLICALRLYVCLRMPRCRAARLDVVLVTQCVPEMRVDTQVKISVYATRQSMEADDVV